MNVTVIGTGYVGLVGGVCMADIGHNVTCVDIDTAKVKMLKEGHVPIYEPGLEEVYERARTNGHISFTTDLAEAVQDAQVVFFALPTPPGENGEADLSYILGAAEDLGHYVDHHMVIVDKSTVPVGTADLVREAIGKNAKADFDVVSNPEFLREGHAVKDFLHPDRIVIGAESERAGTILAELYEPLITDSKQILIMDTRSAEMTKYAANSFLAMKVTFMNEIANLCEEVGADVEAVRHGIGTDERIGHLFLRPGIGYGGSCFPKDVLALHKTADDHDSPFELLDAILVANTRQKLRIVEKLEDRLGVLSGKHFAVWGIAFKPETDDIREAPSLEIITKLLNNGATITAYDPAARENAERYFGDISGLTFSDTATGALTDAEALLILTEWHEFKVADLADIKGRLNRPLIFDGRNVYSPETIKGSGLEYISIGRPTVIG